MNSSPPPSNGASSTNNPQDEVPQAPIEPAPIAPSATTIWGNSIPGQPAAGSLIGCWTPQQAPPVPGPKFRPVFVLKVERDNAQGILFLEVAYGTGQHTSNQASAKQLLPWQIEFNPGEGGLRLGEQTRVDFSKVFRLPYTEKWFARGGKPFNFGRIPKNRVADAHLANSQGKAKIATMKA